MSPRTSQAMFSSSAVVALIMMMMLITLLPMMTFSFSPGAQHMLAYRRPYQPCRSSACHSTPLTAAAIDITGEDDLTKEELGRRFADARDYYRKTNEMSQENVCLSFLRTRLPNLRLNRCFVAQSTIRNAGRGLFANRDIAQGELVTLYPGDALLIWNKTVGDFGQGEVGVMFGPHVTGVDRDAGRLSTDEARSFELKVGPRHSIVADPLLTDDAAYLGHMANDGAILTQRDNKARELYSKMTVARHNAAFFVMEGCHFVMVATNQIRKGEEIFVSYGEGYWLSRSYLQQGSEISGDTTGTAAVTKTATVTKNDKALLETTVNNSKNTFGKGVKEKRAKSNTTKKNGFGK